MSFGVATYGDSAGQQGLPSDYITTPLPYGQYAHMNQRTGHYYIDMDPLEGSMQPGGRIETDNPNLTIPQGGSLPSQSLSAIEFQALDPMGPVGHEVLNELRNRVEESLLTYAESTPDPEADAPDRPRKKKKISKIKTNVPEAEIAKAVAKHTKKKAEEVNRQTQMMEAKIIQEEQRIEEEKKQVALSKNRMNFYKAQKERLEKTPEQIEQEFAASILELKQMENIADVTIDEEDRIIITTQPLSVQKEDWDEPKVAGQYSIRIDFSKNHISSGVRVINITQIFNHYDSPTINNSRCCWGNIQKDIERDFYTQNLTELVLDMMEYVVSPYESHGYIGLNGDKNKGWEQFFQAATPRPAGYSWEQHDIDNPNDEREDAQRAPTLEAMATPSQNIYTISAAVPATTVTSWTTSASDFGIGINRYEQENRHLRERLEALAPSPTSAYERELDRALHNFRIHESELPHQFHMLVDDVEPEPLDRLELSLFHFSHSPEESVFELVGHRRHGTSYRSYILGRYIDPPVRQDILDHRAIAYQMAPPVATTWAGLDTPVPSYFDSIRATTTESSSATLSETEMNRLMNQAYEQMISSQEALRASEQMLDSFRYGVGAAANSNIPTPGPDAPVEEVRGDRQSITIGPTTTVELGAGLRTY